VRAFAPLALALVASCVVPDSGWVASDAPVSRVRRPPPPSPPRVSHPTLIHKQLPSGLMVVLEQDLNATAVGVVAVVRGGASADPAGKEGLAHLVEHLTYRAIDPKPDAPLPLAAEAPGGAGHQTRWERLIRYAASGTNALTGADGISFFEFGPPSRLDWLLDLEVARLADPLAGITPAALALERQIVGVEDALREDPRAGGWATHQLTPLLYPAGHPYARSVGGTSQTRAGLTLADARAFVAKTFRPEQITLLVTAPTALTTIDKIVARLPPALVGDADHPVKRPPAVDAPDAAAPDAPAHPVERRPSPLPTTQLWVGWTLPGSYGRHAAMEDLLGRWVRQDLDLDQLRQDDPHIRSADAVVIPGARSARLLVRALLDDGADPERVAQVVGARVSSMWTRAREQRTLLQRLKTTILTELELDEPSQPVRARYQAEAVAYGPAPVLRANLKVKATEIKDADLAGFAYAHLKSERAHALFFSPAPVAKGEAPPPAPPAAPALDEPFRDAVSWDPMGIPGTPSPIREMTVEKLPNGLTVIAARRHATAAIAWLAFRGGYSDADPPLLVDLALRTRPDAVDAAKYHMLGGRGATRDSTIETVEFPPLGLSPALQLLFAKATTGVRQWPAPDGLDRMLAGIHADEDQASEKAAQAFLAALFGDNPLAHRADRSELKRITRSGVESWVGHVHNIRNAALVVVGDVDPGEVVRAARSLTRNMGSPTWVDAVADLPLPQTRPPGEAHTAVVVTPRPGALVDVRLGCLLPRATADDIPYHQLLGMAIEERLNSALRVQRGEGYGVRVADDAVRGGAAFLTVETSLDAADLAAPLEILRSNWTRWGNEGFDAGEVNVARLRLAGDLPVEYGSSQVLAYLLYQSWKLDPKSLSAQRFTVDVTRLKGQRLNELFATCRANAVLGLTGDESAIRHAVKRSWPAVSAQATTAAR
jgi:zinc protease